MNKAHFLCVLLSFVLVSCLKKEANLPRKTSGAINTISVIIEDQLWNGEVGDSIRNKFASPVIGLPEEEPLFTINQFPIQLLEGFATASRAIIIVKKAAENKFEIKKNQYASPQNVFHISGKTAVEILQLLEEHSPKIIRHIKQAEIEESQRINQKALLPAGLFKKQFQLSIQLPSNFEQVMRKPNFVWFKKNSISGSSSLLLYQLPLNTIRTSTISNAILSMRDSIGKYIQGTEPQSYMISEIGYTPYFFKSTLDHLLAYETRGTWQLQNDYMSGPFINYTIVDSVNKRLVVLEGFCYSPSKEKRDVMHELDAIMHSVHVLKNNTFPQNKK
jgi:hypothetical protein